MNVAIMQPYFFPYIGYFQLIASADVFVVYDNIQYTKKGWINRNRFLLNGRDSMFTIPLKSDSDYLDVYQRSLSDAFSRAKLLNQLVGAYSKAPYFAKTNELLEKVIMFEDNNLFCYIHNALQQVCKFLDIPTKILISSDINIDHTLKGQAKVIEICKSIGADTYVNSIGGLELYNKSDFETAGIALKFIKSKPLVYKQFNSEFVPWLSIVDVLMFNSLGSIQDIYLGSYEYVEPL